MHDAFPIPFHALKMDFPNHSAFFNTQICLSIEVGMGSHKLLYFRLLLDIVLYILFPLLYLLLGDLQ